MNPKRNGVRRLKKADFLKLVTSLGAWLEERGAKNLRIADKKTTEAGPAIECTLDTRAGRLDVFLYEGWMACRFDDEKAARAAHIDCNPNTGKYNCHPGIGPDTRWETLLQAYAAHLSATFIPKAVS